MSVVRLSMDPIDGVKGGTARRAHVLTRSGGGGVWDVIVGYELVGPFRVADGVEMTALVYIDFLKEHLTPWHKKKNLAFHKNMGFKHGLQT